MNVQMQGRNYRRLHAPLGGRVRYLPVLLLAVLGFAVTVYAYGEARGREAVTAQQEFERRAAVFAAAFQGSIDGHMQVLPTIGTFTPLFTGVPTEQVEALAVPAMGPFIRLNRQRYPGLESFAWLTPEVGSQESGGSPSARTRYLVMVADPPIGLDAVVGADYAFDSIRRDAIERAITSGSVSVSGRITVITADGFRDGVLVVLPIAEGGAAGQPGAPVIGLLVLTVRFDKVLNASLGDLTEGMMHITLVDDDAAGLADPVMASWGPLAMTGDEADAGIISSFVIAGRHWRLIVQPTAAFYAVQRSATSWILLAAGLALTVLLCVYVATVIQRAGRISRLAAAREREIGQRVRAEEAVRASEARYRALVQHSSDMVLLLNRSGALTYVSPASARVLGQDAGALVGAELLLLVHPADRPTVRQTLGRMEGTVEAPFAAEWRMRHVDGGWRWLEATVSNLLDEPGVQGIVLNIRDVTERKRLETELMHQAFNDNLTALPNRALFLDRLSHALASSRRAQTGLAVLYVDLDGFKVVNDSLGHGAGDALLVEVGRRLAGAVRPGDTVARFGGDEFAVLLANAAERDDATGVAERILSALRTPVLLGEREVVVSCSIGVALQPPDVPERDLLREADIALYQAKEAGKDQLAVFDPSMERQVARRLDLELDLRRALERNEFRVYYQPEVEPDSGRIVGMEALVRWQHPTRGLISPAEFIGLAEETGLIVPLGLWVLREACHQARTWQADAPDLQLSVNLSARQLTQPELAEQVAAILAETGLPPATLRLELTESILMDDGPETLRTLQALTNLGASLAIDDFGTGYASLTYLQRFPISTLKIDRSFISVADHDPRARAIVQTVTDLAHALGLIVTAEGIETREHLSCVAAAGCDHGQGYFFSRPVSGPEMEMLLAHGVAFGPPPGAVA